MKFDRSRVFTALNADEVKAGGKGYFADTIALLEELVNSGDKGRYGTLAGIGPATEVYRFRRGVNFITGHALFYLVEGPVEKNTNLDSFLVQENTLGLWEQSVCKIRDEIMAGGDPALVYAKELCDKLVHSMCALAGGPYSLEYTVED